MVVYDIITYMHAIYPIIDHWYTCSVNLELMVDQLLEDDWCSDYIAICRLCKVPAFSCGRI